jgi:pimeloyl-ACP methyl ester carboxylesterase
MSISVKVLLPFTLLAVYFISWPQSDFAYLFAHGLRSNYIQYRQYLKLEHFQAAARAPEPYLIYEPIVTFNFPDSLDQYEAARTSFAQEDEVDALAHAYLDATKIGKSIILFGLSRGAAAIINFAGRFHPQAACALILESPPDCMKNLIATHVKRLHLRYLPHFLIETVPSIMFGKYDKAGLAPIDMIDKIDKQIPILLIASLEDNAVFPENTINLYLKLLASDFKKAHLLLLNRGGHAQLLWGPQGDIYQAVTHAFYKHYQLPHDQELAEKGHAYFIKTQPSKTILEKVMSENKSYLF